MDTLVHVATHPDVGVPIAFIRQRERRRRLVRVKCYLILYGDYYIFLTWCFHPFVSFFLLFRFVSFTLPPPPPLTLLCYFLMLWWLSWQDDFLCSEQRVPHHARHRWLCSRYCVFYHYHIQRSKQRRAAVDLIVNDIDSNINVFNVIIGIVVLGMAKNHPGTNVMVNL